MSAALCFPSFTGFIKGEGLTLKGVFVQELTWDYLNAFVN
jgi:hypothetical protein